MSKFSKDIKFTSPDLLEPSELAACVPRVLNKLGDSTFWSWAATVRHQKEGAQMWISKEVSDDLLHSDIIDDDLSELDWPHHTLELVFEDPKLPTFLMQLGSRQEMGERMRSYCDNRIPKFLINGAYSNDGRDASVDIICCETSGMLLSMALGWGDMNRFAHGLEMGDVFKSDSAKLGNVTDTDIGEIEAELRRVAVLGFKVLMFASSEGCAPRVTMDAPTKKQGGKPGFKNRPKTKRLIVEYLPRQRQERKKSDAEKGKREFKGRRGHWRRFRSSFYKNKQGARKFIYPVPGPDGTIPSRIQFRVVKPH